MHNDKQKLLMIMRNLESDYRNGKISVEKYRYFRSKYEDKLNALDAKEATSRIRSMQGKSQPKNVDLRKRPTRDPKREEQDLVQKYIINPKKGDKNLSKKDHEVTGNDKTSIIFSIFEDHPGELYKILGIFNKDNVNLTKIESRPSKRGLGKYLFFVDFYGHRNDNTIKKILKELELNTGKITCIWNGLSVSPAREEAMTLSKPYLANRMIIITNQDSPLKTKADLEGKKVGLQTGSTAVAALEKDPISKKLTQVTYENNVLALTDLNIGRIDAVVMDEVVARYMIAKSANLYKVLNDSFDEEFYAIAFKKGNTELKDKVEKALADMAADGTSAEISKKWFGEDIVLK